MKKFYLIFAAVVIAAVLIGCPNGTERSSNTETTISGGNNGGQGQGSDNKAPVITARITAMPKVTYIEGETFSLAGIRVTVYSDGKAAADLTNDAVFRYDAPDMSNIGTTDVEISFDYSGETLTVTLTINIEEDKTHGYTVEIFDETKTRLPLGGKPFSADGVYYQLYDPTGNPNFGYGFLTKTVSDTDMTQLGKQTVTVTFSFRPHALNEEVVLTTSLEIEVIEFGIFTAADITKICWNDLKDEMNNLEERKKANMIYYDPYDWTKAFPDNTTDWSKVKDVTIDISTAETVDVISLSVLKKYVEAKLDQANNSSEIRFANYEGKKLELDFTELQGITNVQFMNALIDPLKLEFDIEKMNDMGTPGGFVFGMDGTSDITSDLIPGVELVSFPCIYEPSGYYPEYEHISQAFKFTSPAVVTMPQDTTYDLTGAYKGGILGDVTIDINGLENATMSGEIYKHDIKGIYDTFVKDKTDLPTLNIKLLDRPSDINDNINLMNRSINGGYQELNVYGTEIDKLIETYYKNGQAGGFTLKNLAGSCLSFDGSEYVLAKGGSMYQEQGNEPTGNTYKLGINAALVMAQAGMNISDVNVVDQSYDAVDSRDSIFGAGDHAATQDFVNVRFEADMSRFSFSSNTISAGIIDIAGPAPQNLPSVGSSAVVIRPEAISDTPIDWNQMAYILDLSALSSEQSAKVHATGSHVRTADNISESDATIREIEQGTRKGKSITAIEDEHNNHASVSPKKMKEKKDADLMRAILNGKDKEYS